jgi:hypothetical protein
MESSMALLIEFPIDWAFLLPEKGKADFDGAFVRFGEKLNGRKQRD